MQMAGLEAEEEPLMLICIHQNMSSKCCTLYQLNENLVGYIINIWCKSSLSIYVRQYSCRIPGYYFVRLWYVTHASMNVLPAPQLVQEIQKQRMQILESFHNAVAWNNKQYMEQGYGLDAAAYLGRDV